MVICRKTVRTIPIKIETVLGDGLDFYNNPSNRGIYMDFAKRIKEHLSEYRKIQLKETESSESDKGKGQWRGKY